MKKILLGMLSVAAPAFFAATAGAATPNNVSAALDASAYGLLVKLPIRSESRAEFLQLIKDRVAQSRQRPEVIDFRVLATQDAQVFIAYESFQNKDAFSAFEKLPESQHFLNELKPLLMGSPEVSILQPLP